MEYLVINEGKLKITLTGEDKKTFGLCDDELDYRDPEVRRAFWRVLDRAQEECGFKVSGEKLLIQYYPSSEIAEIFVTRLCKLSVGAERSITSADGVAMLSSRDLIFRFTGIEELERLLFELRYCGEEPNGEVYFSEDGYYYLFIEERCDLATLSPFSVAFEFGEEIPQNLGCYIKEHSTLLHSVT